MRYSASALRERVEVLKLQAVEGGWAWAPVRQTWAGVEVTDKTNLFSKVGIGARDARLALRRQDLTLHNALRWKGQHLFLTSLAECQPGWLEGKAALVEPVECLAVRTEDAVGKGGKPIRRETMRLAFPSMLTEKYSGYAREETHAEIRMTYVLVTPKAVCLEMGDVVTVKGGNAPGSYYVTVPHMLDDFKNEYEAAWKGDA